MRSKSIVMIQRAIWLLAAGATLLASPTKSMSVQQRLENEIRHELVMLPEYGIFDNLSFQYANGKVTLLGQVSRPILRSEAEHAVKGIEGVQSVQNQIEVLPVSPNDDRIRLAVFRTLFRDDSLMRYAMRAVPPIHIIVKNGNVDLQGMVASQQDKNLAGIKANQVPGVFSVRNDLQIDK